jgi:hypothetical protein
MSISNCRLTDELEKPARAFCDYFDSVREALPSSVIQLWDEYTLHDAQLTALKVDFDANEVTMDLHGFVGGLSEQCQYHLVFSGVVQLLTEGSPERPMGGPGGFGHLGYYEFEVLGDGLFESRMLFSTGTELTLQWSGLRVQAAVIENG